MKKIVLTVFMILAAVFVFGGCGEGSGDDTVVISERFFVHEMQEVVFNHQQYLGRTIQFEGMFRIIPMGGIDRFLVMRYMVGCCGEEPVGLEVVMENIPAFDYNAWVEVTGILEMNNGFLVLQLTNIVELDERGLEVV